ncbi:MAG: type II toxin-antitoxin system Phd/YefM family antitoxin [Herpetosiphon sp.]|nr:type II toxin-antitoxin system Phd/YefM family antitoxin [Herpetosiphon sp.]
MITTTYTQARENFASFCDTATEQRELVYIQRRDKEDVVLIAADELNSLLETAHLLRSPANAQRLLSALQDVQMRLGKAQTLAELRQEMLGE